MKELRNGLLTGLTLQFAIGPVFFFILNLVLQKSIWHGFAGVAGAATADYIYITLAILGIGRLLEQPRVKRVFGVVSALVLIGVGISLLRGALGGTAAVAQSATAGSVWASYGAVFGITISSPLTIVFFTGLFAAKALEYGYTRRQLFLFGFGTGMATLLFMGGAVVLFSLIRAGVPVWLVGALNGAVGCLLAGYGGVRLWKTLREKPEVAIALPAGG